MTTKTNPFATRLAQVAAELKAECAPRAERVTTFRELLPQHPQGTATRRQLAFIDALMRDKDLTGETRQSYRDRLAVLFVSEADREAMTTAQASALIDYLKEFPAKAASAVSPDNDVPAGHYAVRLDLGPLGFFRVDRPTEGQWKGYTFVTRQVGSDFVRISRRMQAQVLKEIREAGAKEAAILYGHELGRCAMCHRELTNEDSRAAGIGPVCAAKHGW